MDTAAAVAAGETRGVCGRRHVYDWSRMAGKGQPLE